MNRYVLSLLVVTAISVGASGVTWAGTLENGIKAYDRKDYQQAYEQLLPLAEEGVDEAQFYVGGMLVDGMGVEADSTKGVYWLEKAAENRHAMAAKQLGNMYLSGFGVPMDPQKGAKYILMYEANVFPDEADSGCD
jgi:TPR repeat protein